MVMLLVLVTRATAGHTSVFLFLVLLILSMSMFFVHIARAGTCHASIIFMVFVVHNIFLNLMN